MKKLIYLDTSKITVKKILYAVLTVLIPIICVGGASYFPYTFRLPFMYITAIIFAVTFVFSDLKIRLSFPSVCFLLLLSYIAISIILSLDPASTASLFLIYLCSATMLFLDLPQAVYHRIIFIMYVICIIIAFSIVISVFIDDFINKYLWIIVNPGRSSETISAIRKELSLGAYSGLAREKAEAAYIMNVGIAISFARYFSKSKFEKFELLFLIILFAALILTGKRTFFLIPIICFIVLITISKSKNKAIKFLSVMLISAVALFVIMMFFPEMANIFYRFADSENMESMGNRDLIWKYMFMMISDYWAFGGGFGSFNQYAYDHGFRVYNEKWEYNAHNSYFQVIGELGIIGITLLALFIISSLILTIKLIAKYTDPKKLELLYGSLYIQIMIAIYSVTGNPLYTKQILFIWLFSIGVMLYVKNDSEYKIKTLPARRNYNYG